MGFWKCILLCQPYESRGKKSHSNLEMWLVQMCQSSRATVFLCARACVWKYFMPFSTALSHVSHDPNPWFVISFLVLLAIISPGWHLYGYLGVAHAMVPPSCPGWGFGAEEPDSSWAAVGLEGGEVREWLSVGVWMKCLCACPGVLCVQEKSLWYWMCWSLISLWLL